MRDYKLGHSGASSSVRGSGRASGHSAMVFHCRGRVQKGQSKKKKDECENLDLWVPDGSLPNL